MSIELYKQVILNRSKSVKYRGKPDSFEHSAYIKNPLCGDELTVFYSTDEDNGVSVNFEGFGCAICFSSADLMAENANGMRREQIPALLDGFLSMIENGTAVIEEMSQFIDDYAAIAKTREFPSRIRCATLPWIALKSASNGK